MPQPSKPLRAGSVPLRVSVDRPNEWVEALEFGAVSDGKPFDEFIEVGENVRWTLRTRRGPVIGFQVRNFGGLDAEDGTPELWSSPRFRVPTLGLRRASAGEILLGVDGMLVDACTADWMFFHLAVAAGDEEDREQAIVLWRSCLETGDLRGHFGLGYTYCELERHHEAYAHLRTYAELTPHNSWAWSWLGQACEGKGDIAEARSAYRRALRLERRGSFETDAAERLQELGRR